MKESLPDVSTALPEIEQVAPQVIEARPDARLLLRGRNFDGVTAAEVGGREAEVLSASGTALALALPPGLAAGAQVVQVFRDVQLGNPPTTHRLYASDPASFILRPRLLGPPEISGDRELTVTVEPLVAEGQPVALLLNEITGDAERAPASFRLPVRPPGTGSELRFALNSVRAGSYLVRLQVAGVSSALTVDDDPESPTFDQYVAPRVTVP